MKKKVAIMRTRNKTSILVPLIVGVLALDLFAFGLIPQPQQMKRNGGEFEIPGQSVEEVAKSATFERDVTVQP
jgi:hypothetical protein